MTPRLLRRLGMVLLTGILLSRCGTPADRPLRAPDTDTLARTPPAVAKDAPRAWDARPVLITLEHSVSGLSMYADAWANMPQLVVYADGTVIRTTGAKVETARIERAALCGLLLRIEANGFFDFDPQDYVDPEITDSGTTVIRVHAWRSQEVAAYAFLSAIRLSDTPMAMPAALADTYALLDGYLPPGLALYQPERIALLVEADDSIDGAALWPLPGISPGDVVATANQQRTAPEIILDGQQAADLYAQFAGTNSRPYSDNGTGYHVTMRPLLPLQADPTAEFPTEPTVALDCAGAEGAMPPHATLPPPTPTPAAPDPGAINEQSPLVYAGAIGQRDAAGQFDTPANLIVSPRGEVYADDAYNQRIQVFALDGALRAALPLSATASGDLAMDPSGRLLVADGERNQIEIRAADGTFQRMVSGWPPAEPPANNADYVAAVTWGPDGALFLTEYEGNRVVALNADGSLREIWTGPAERPIAGITALETAADGTLYVASASQNRVLRRQPDGRVDDIALENPQHIAPAADGALYVADESQVSVYDASQTLVARWGLRDLPIDYSTFIIDIAAAPDGSIVLLGRAAMEQMAAVIHHYSRDGAHLASFGSTLVQPGQFDAHGAFAVSAQGDAWLIDIRSWLATNTLPPRLVHVDATGRHLKTIDQLDGQAFDCDNYRLAALANQQVLVANACDGTLTRLDADGALLDRWGRRGHDEGSFDLIAGLALAPDEQSVYILDTGQRALVQVGLDGTPLKRWDTQSLGSAAPGAFALDGSGGFVFVDMATQRLISSGPAGQQHAWSLPDPAHQPYRVAVDGKRGRIYVTAIQQDLTLFEEMISNSEMYLYVFDLAGAYLGRHHEAGRGYIFGVDLAVGPEGQLLRASGYSSIPIYRLR